MARSEELRKIAEEFAKKFAGENAGVRAVFLTGSVARGEADEFSDVDLTFIYDSLSGDPKDNMSWEDFKGETIQIYRTTLADTMKDIDNLTAFKISEYMTSVSILDPSNMHKQILDKISRVDFHIDLPKRLNQARDAAKAARRAFTKGDDATVHLLSDLYSYWAVQDYMLLKRNPHTAPKRILAQLKKVDPVLEVMYSDLISEHKTERKLLLFERLVEELLTRQ